LWFSGVAGTFAPLLLLANSFHPVLKSALRRVFQGFTDGSDEPTYGLVLSGGGARAAYQVGALRYISEAFPGTYFPVLTGVSAGAINTAHLGNHTGTFADATDHLEDCWLGLKLERVVEVESGFNMIWGLLRQQISQGGDPPSAVDVRETHGLLNINPLWHYLRDQLGAPDGRLTGIPANLEADRLQAVAIVTTNYSTGQTVTWVQGDDFEVWERPDRISLHDQLTIDHVMASTALPLVFPAVKIGDAWYGDGGIRLQAPLAPAVHLGSDRILVISNRHRRSRPEAEQKAVHGYPPAAHIIGILMNSIFLDALDQDAFTLERVNTLVEELPPHQRHGMRPVDLLQLRPSVDLGRLAYDYEDRIPSSFQFLTSGLGTRETESLDWLSVLLFDPVYIDRLLDIGYHDARRRHDRIERFLSEMGEGSEKGRQRLGTPGEEDV